MNLTRRIDLVGYLHIGYGAVLLVLAAVMIVMMTAGAIVLPTVAAWMGELGAGLPAAAILSCIGLPSVIAGVGLIRRASWARAALIVLSMIDLFSFPFGTALGGFSLWTLLKERARLEFA